VRLARTETLSFVDGGVFANNPSMIALVEARRLFPEGQDFLLVSLGSGAVRYPLRYEQARGWGVAQWARPILNVFQAALTNETDAFDNTTAGNFAALERLGDQLIRENKAQLDQRSARSSSGSECAGREATVHAWPRHATRHPQPGHAAIRNTDPRRALEVAESVPSRAVRTPDSWRAATPVYIRTVRTP
jgi:hypothetical protein